MVKDKNIDKRTCHHKVQQNICIRPEGHQQVRSTEHRWTKHELGQDKPKTRQQQEGRLQKEECLKEKELREMEEHCRKYVGCA